VALGWRAKRRFIPGGVDGVFEEVVLSEQHIRLAGNPNTPIRRLIEAGDTTDPKRAPLP
jgi:hypothetical protein